MSEKITYKELGHIISVEFEAFGVRALDEKQFTKFLRSALIYQKVCPIHLILMDRVPCVNAAGHNDYRFICGMCIEEEEL